ncbi:DNA-binding protein [Candidatus Geothermarchaeota archaeon]|nr:MAG: DNA-binding protein [Candidatus Geothermarchaeota archaeon]
MQIKDLKVGMRRVNIEATVESISATREVQSRYTGRVHKVATAVIFDESGKIDLVLWNEQIGMISPGDKIKIENGYVSTFRGKKQLSIGRYGKLSRV